jgi:hypothetical protein
MEHMVRHVEGPAVNYETFLEDLHAFRDRAGRFQFRVGSPASVDAALTEALQELDVALSSRPTRPPPRPTRTDAQASPQLDGVRRKLSRRLP